MKLMKPVVLVKAADALKKVNKDCNLTAGLQAELTVAVGARVMLRRNIDTKHGLVNGAIGTIVAITSQRITVKFDHIIEPYPVERVKSKFMLMKSFFIYRKQFPLILAYAVTIHKCQGLSLNCAIIDLSNKVFSPGMAYVALSRVRSLDGLYLTDFDPSSIMVSNSCLEEINRLRSIYRKDLPLYDIIENKKGPKRKLTIMLDEQAPLSKKPRLLVPPRKLYKRKATQVAEQKPVKKKKAMILSKMTVILLMWKMPISVQSGQILGFTLSMKSGRDKPVKLWGYSSKQYLTTTSGSRYNSNSSTPAH